MKFGEFLQAQRETKGVSKYQLSRMTGISMTALTGYENLKHEPTISVGVRLCNALKVEYVLGSKE